MQPFHYAKTVKLLTSKRIKRSAKNPAAKQAWLTIQNLSTNHQRAEEKRERLAQKFGRSFTPRRAAHVARFQREYEKAVAPRALIIKPKKKLHSAGTANI